jgi:hypothetical protein
VQKIKVTVPLAGISLGKRTVKIETDGFTGATCQNVTEALNKLLGQTVGTELKAEYFATNDPVYETHNEK